MDKMRIAATKKDDSFLGTASSFLGDVAEGSGFNNFLADKAQKQAALKKSQAAKDAVEQSVMTASQYTPAGHAPAVQPVAGGIPATAQTEAEKVYDALSVQLDQKNLRAETKQLANSVEADASYSVAAGQIEQKNTRAFTDKLAKDTAAEAAYSIVSGQLDAKNARANSIKIANEVEADAAYATVAAQLDQKAARAYTNKLFEEIMALKTKKSK